MTVLNTTTTIPSTDRHQRYFFAVPNRTTPEITNTSTEIAKTTTEIANTSTETPNTSPELSNTDIEELKQKIAAQLKERKTLKAQLAALQRKHAALLKELETLAKEPRIAALLKERATLRAKIKIEKTLFSTVKIINEVIKNEDYEKLNRLKRFWNINASNMALDINQIKKIRKNQTELIQKNK